MKWFRLYHSLAESKRVGRLSDHAFRFYILCQCAASKKRDGGRTDLSGPDADWEFRMDGADALAECCATSPPLLTMVDGMIVVPDWDERQMASDTSANRVQRFRERHKKPAVADDVTLPKRRVNAIDKSRGDTDTENKAQVVPLVRPVVTPLPETHSMLVPLKSAAPAKETKGTRLSPDWKLPKRWGEWALQHQPTWTADMVRDAADRFRDHFVAATGQVATKRDWLATWRNWVRGRPRGTTARTAKLDKRAAVAKQLYGGEHDQRNESPPEIDITAESKRIP